MRLYSAASARLASAEEGQPASCRLFPSVAPLQPSPRTSLRRGGRHRETRALSGLGLDHSSTPCWLWSAYAFLACSKAEQWSLTVLPISQLRGSKPHTGPVMRNKKQPAEILRSSRVGVPEAASADHDCGSRLGKSAPVPCPMSTLLLNRKTQRRFSTIWESHCVFPPYGLSQVWLLSHKSKIQEDISTEPDSICDSRRFIFIECSRGHSMNGGAPPPPPSHPCRHQTGTGPTSIDKRLSTCPS